MPTTSKLVLSILLLVVFTQQCFAYSVTATGRIFCHGKGVPQAQISLMDEDALVHDKMGSSTTDEFGYFTVTGSATDVGFGNYKRPDVYIQMDYKHHSSAARFEIKKGLVDLNQEEKSIVLKNRKGSVDFGTLVFDTDACNAYLKMYDAMHDFHSRTGFRVPFNLTVRTEYPLHGGTPYAFYKTIHIPPGYDFRKSTAQHELAHTVRHHYDGSFSFFLSLVVQYMYTQSHTCTSKTNDGFAFNEGWAEYWSNTCQNGDPNGPEDVEQNVATGLRHLQDNCSTIDYNMWRVLRQNPGKIHSFTEFKLYHKSLFGC